MLNIQRGSILRAYFSLQAILTWATGVFEPKSVHSLVTQEAGPLGSVVLALMGVLGVMCYVDVLINDTLPKRFNAYWLLRHRHLMLMLLAMFNAAELFVAVHLISAWGLAFHCLLNVLFIVTTAFRDVQLRYPRKEVCAI